MLKRLPSAHHQFAHFFPDENIRPLAYAVSLNLANQSICIDLSKDLEPLLKDWEQKEKPNLEDLRSYAAAYGSYIGKGLEDLKPFIYDNGNFYIRRYFSYESGVIDHTKRIAAVDKNLLRERFSSLNNSDFLKEMVLKRDKDVTIDWQVIAAITAYVQSFTVITGGPGTGKTTTVARILALLIKENPDCRVKLAAFTGKAGKRMEESLREATAKLEVSEEIRVKLTSFSALTLHRLLGYKKDSHFFRHNNENPIAADVVIVDEASMIDVPLFAKLLQAIGDNTRLILLGDQNQLTSVEAGSVFGDLCNSVDALNKFSGSFKDLINQSSSEQILEQSEVNTTPSELQDHVVELRKSWRVKDNVFISRLSKAVLLGKKGEVTVREIYESDPIKEKIIIDENYDPAVLESFAADFRKFIVEANKEGEQHTIKALEELNKLRILSPVREGKEGIYNLNRMVEGFLEKQGLIKVDSKDYENRPVMITRNNYELNVFNGDVGIIKYLRGTPHVYIVNNKGELKHHPTSYISDMETAFASTVHKSQGSEFEKVMVVLPKKFKERIMTRELLYTGITRAKKQLTLQATREVVLESMGNTIKRASGITNRMNQR
ncbi:DNA helicase/exodeoxyribonuclease V, alpha subunit [Salegentibacter agarivorans]|uniref:RecBCD enzyme subunit RecD n=1 Tax=Salegentibacter agarivorans TaxID=345907 RepID=A0A1I2N201_9FLAO|nr:exodeoxyribonuclease V subunit alpha [Salegentibacter agarivorans]SFF95767.1 DNA helicase/exodeoxyribonuclease V, alpha subunit [Salegentibacter agarivorans]